MQLNFDRLLTGKYLQDALNYINKGDYMRNVHLHINFSTAPLDKSEGSEDIPLTAAMKMDSTFCKNGKFKPYQGLPRKLSSVLKWKKVYKEMVTQYNKFIELTQGKANYEHIDFHSWYNLTWPVAIALNVFTRKYHIKSVRYIGLHQKAYGLFRILSWDPRVKSYPATNIDFFLSKYKSFKDNQVIELYCHPNYKEDGTFLDDSPSYIKHERRTMIDQIQDLRAIGNSEFISWEDDFLK